MRALNVGISHCGVIKKYLSEHTGRKHKREAETTARGKGSGKSIHRTS